MNKPVDAEPVIEIRFSAMLDGGRASDEISRNHQHDDAEHVEPVIEPDGELPNIYSF